MNKRNHFLDFWKFIAAIGVILVHIQFPGNCGIVLASVGTWGVALFATISGYACYGDKNTMPAMILSRFKRNGLITVIIVGLYIIFSYLEMSLNSQLYYWEMGFTNPDSYSKMLLYGDFCFFYGAPLWYLVALLYCYIIFYLLVKYASKPVFYILLPVTLILRITTSMYVSYYNASRNLSSNFLVGILPMMLLGYVIADNKEKLCKIRTSVLITGAVVSAICMFASLFVRLSGLELSYILQLFCVFFVFCIGIKHPELYIFKPFAFLGEKDTFNIYLFHIMVILTLKNILNRLPIPLETLRWLLPAASIIGSVLFARLLTVILSKLKVYLSSKEAKSRA